MSRQLFSLQFRFVDLLLRNAILWHCRFGSLSCAGLLFCWIRCWNLFVPRRVLFNLHIHFNAPMQYTFVPLPPFDVVQFLNRRRRLPTYLRPRSWRLSTQRRWTPITTSRCSMFYIYSTHVARHCLDNSSVWCWVMCRLSLQSGGPTESGDSDKSKSEVNDGDEEVKANPPVPCPTLVFHCWFYFVDPKPYWSRPFEIGFAGWWVMDDGWNSGLPKCLQSAGKSHRRWA